MRKPLKQALFLAVPLASLVALSTMTACPGSLEDPSRFREGGLCTDVPDDILKPKCATQAGCHSAADMSAGLDLQTANPGTRLLGKVSGTAGQTQLVIDPTNPQNSLLYTKLTNPPFGAKMPFLNTIDSASVACILTWVESVVGGDGGAGEGGTTGDTGTPASDAASE